MSTKNLCSHIHAIVWVHFKVMGRILIVIPTFVMNYLFSWNTQQNFSLHWLDIKRKTWSAFEAFSHGGHKLITVKYFHSWTNFLIVMVKYECTLDIMISRPALQKTHAVSTQPMHIPLILQCAYNLFSNCYSGIS